MKRQQVKKLNKLDVLREKRRDPPKMNELGKIVRPQSPTRTCKISPEDSSHIGLILSETKVKDKSGEKLLGMRSNEIVCALSSKTIFLSNSGQVVSNIDLPYYWCNFCAFKTEDKHLLLRHLMEHRFNCQYCIYQTFSRVDVVRHTVKEHNQFDSDNLKFCVLLPDLLKHGMNDCDDNTNGQPKCQTPPPFQNMEEETEEKQKPQGGKRKKGGRSDHAPSPKKKKGEEEGEKKESGSDNTTIVTPGVCFECCICKFRTFQKPVLTAHNNRKHDRPRPSFSLKVVSRSQAKEIEEMDTKLSSKVKRCPKSTKTPTEPPVRRSSPRTRGSANSKEKEKEEEEEKESFPAPEVEMDYAAEDDDNEDDDIDGDYYGDDADDNEDDYDDDNDEDFVPSSKEGKTAKKKREDEPVNPVKTVKRIFKCLLCPNKTSEEFSIVKQHYIEEHPGGTQIMREFYDDGSSVKISYFCVGDNCEFQDTEALSWLNHCVLCQKEAMENPDPLNTRHESVQNTINTVKENLGLLVVQNPEPIESKPVIGDLQLSPVKQAVRNIKQEMSDNVHLASSHNDQTLESVYVYGHALPENVASHQKNLPTCQNQPQTPTQPVLNQQNTTTTQNPPFVVEQNPDYVIQQNPEYEVQQNQELIARLNSSVSPKNPTRSHNALVNRIQMMKRSQVRTEPLDGTCSGGSVSSASVVFQASSPAQVSPKAHMSSSSAGESQASLVSTSDTTSTSFSTSSTSTLSSIPVSTSASPSATPSLTGSASTSTTGTGTGSDKDRNNKQTDLKSALAAKILKDGSKHNNQTKKNPIDSQVDKKINSIDNQKSQSNPQQRSSRTSAPKTTSISTKDNKKATTASPNKETKSKSSKSSKKEKSPKKSNGDEALDIDQRGNFKCAHCRFLGVKPLEVRTHMLDKHRMNPLYGLDMMAEVNNQPRFVMFCPKESCKYCTKDKDAFLSHFEKCTLVEDGGEKITSEYKKRVEVTRNFVNKILQKLLSLTMG